MVARVAVAAGRSASGTIGVVPEAQTRCPWGIGRQASRQWQELTGSYAMELRPIMLPSVSVMSETKP